jgi:hypothetical protein
MKGVRMNIIVPIDLVDELSKTVGARKRSSFIVEATREKLNRVKLGNALKEAKGSWSDEDYPEFKTQEDISRWVRSLREIDTNRLKGIDIE